MVDFDCFIKKHERKMTGTHLYGAKCGKWGALLMGNTFISVAVEVGW